MGENMENRVTERIFDVYKPSDMVLGGSHRTSDVIGQISEHLQMGSDSRYGAQVIQLSEQDGRYSVTSFFADDKMKSSLFLTRRQRMDRAFSGSYEAAIDIGVERDSLLDNIGSRLDLDNESPQNAVFVLTGTDNNRFMLGYVKSKR